MSSRLSDWIPPAIARAATHQARYETRFIDGFDSWEQAQQASAGYDEQRILARVLAATRAVVAGTAAMERDGVELERLDVRWPVIASLLLAAHQDGGRLSVLDVGGSLGSSYRQSLHLLEGLQVEWGVVEQPSFVAAGREFADDRLRFHHTIAECAAAIKPNIALCSSVLQYLPDPHAIVREVAALNLRLLVIDRTPMTSLDVDVPVIQVAPSALYKADYPAWLLSRSLIERDFVGWACLDDFDSIEPDARSTHGIAIRWRGMIWKRAGS